MGLFQANIWKASFFKSIKSLFSSPTRTILCVLVSENGIASKVTHSLGIGYLADTQLKMTWMAINKLRMPMEGVEGMVLPISERTYIPLDPLGRLTDEDKKSLVPLDDIYLAKRREARARVSAESRVSANAEAIKTLMYVLAFIALIALGVLVFKK
jgi:hypothetical protein